MTSTFALPALDHQSSPHTGWTRSHWQYCADRLLAGAAAHASPSGARIRFPGPAPADDTDELEGFARAFMLGALRVADRGDKTPPAVLEQYAAALAAGTTPGNVDQWPIIGHHDQALVEATAVVVGLHWSRPWLWDQLTDNTKAQLVDWLSLGRNSWCADNNHVLLGATVQAFLASVGADHDPDVVDGALNRIDDWYTGDGWYSDGEGRRFDHYNGWTFHLYPFLIEQMLAGLGASSAGTNPAFDLHRNRLRMFLDDYQHLFDATGSPLIQGRSLIYRWGTAAPFWMGELQAASPLPPGRTRRLVSGTLSSFVNAGAIDDGVLDLGWKRPAPDLTQSYNAAGSPLWASKGFLGLLLPPDHPAWTDTETPLPIETRDVLRPMGGPRWVAVGRRDGIARVLNHGSDGHPRRPHRLYRRLAYSTATVPVDIDGLADNTILVGPRHAPSTHRGLLAGTVHRGGAASRWRADAQGRDVVIELATLILGESELRLARVSGSIDQAVTISGWPLSSDQPAVTHSLDGQAIEAEANGLFSSIAWVSVPNGARPQVHVEARSHRNALGEHVALPWGEVLAGDTGQLQVAWLVRLGSTPAPARGHHEITVQWKPDGAFVLVGEERYHCAWARHQTWRADDPNQGIFRVGTIATSC